MSMSETLRIIEVEEELKRLRAQHTQLLNHVRAIEELTAACEQEFGSNEIGHDGDLLFDDDDTVSDPNTSITFGMIRRARQSIKCIKDVLS